MGNAVRHAHPDIAALNLYHKPSAEACLLAPSLIDAVDRIATHDGIAQGVDGYECLALVAVGLHHDVHLPCSFCREAE